MLRLDLDISGLRRLMEIGDRVDVAMKNAARDLTAMAHARSTELASQRLRSRRQLFVESLSMVRVDDSTWMLSLAARAAWIDVGKDPQDMLPALLASSKAKVSKKGQRYLVVPFKVGPAVQNASIVQQETVDAVRAEMKRRNIPWGGVEKDASGRPLYGKLHSFSMDAPLKGAMGPGQGHGSVGAPRQGMSARNAAVNQGAGGFESNKSRGGGVGMLSGVTVYQRPTEAGGTRRDVVTFRVASELHRGSGRWRHPGTKPANIFEDVHHWLVNMWENEVGPAVIASIRG